MFRFITWAQDRAVAVAWLAWRGAQRITTTFFVVVFGTKIFKQTAKR